MEIIIEEYGEAILAIVAAVPIIEMFAEFLHVVSAF